MLLEFSHLQCANVGPRPVLFSGQIEDGESQVALDLNEMTLVDIEVIHFLIACEARGVEVLNCPRYIRKWTARERSRQE
jgi:hypothetical protein